MCVIISSKSRFNSNHSYATYTGIASRKAKILHSYKIQQNEWATNMGVSILADLMIKTSIHYIFLAGYQMNIGIYQSIVLQIRLRTSKFWVDHSEYILSCKVALCCGMKESWKSLPHSHLIKMLRLKKVRHPFVSISLKKTLKMELTNPMEQFED